MSEPKFTKGPWKLFNKKGDVVSAETGDLIVKWDAYHTEEQQLADSALIAAAPEMYDMLEEVKGKLDRSARISIGHSMGAGWSREQAKGFFMEYIEINKRIKAVLQKARGKQ
jgi:hypothetical protein